jgi:hypothetical protein
LNLLINLENWKFAAGIAFNITFALLAYYGGKSVASTAPVKRAYTRFEKIAIGIRVYFFGLLIDISCVFLISLLWGDSKSLAAAALDLAWILLFLSIGYAKGLPSKGGDLVAPSCRG